MTEPTSTHRPHSARLTDAWQRRGALAVALLPLAGAYWALTALRRALYRWGWLARYRAPTPVVVVGNVVAGGAGKTPVTIHLVQALQALGWRPGVISRGYGRSSHAAQAGAQAAIAVTACSEPQHTGDEPLLIALRTGVPVYVACRRADAARALLAQHPEVNVLISDDGLQHLALQRDLEIAVFNRRGIGNGWLLPAGPLREPWPRALDVALYAGQAPCKLPAAAHHWHLQRCLADYATTQNGQQVPLSALGQQAVQAVAAIAYPDEFFAMLRSKGLQLAHCHALPDHADFDSLQVRSALGLAAENHAAKPTMQAPVLLCTEKDAHKLWRIAPKALAVPLLVDIDCTFAQHIHKRLLALQPAPAKAPH